MLKYPNCEICRRLREVLPKDEVPDEIINAYHESKGSYELFPKKWQDTVIDVMLEFEKPKNDCRYWGENVFPFFDDGCHIGHSFCNPKECEDYEPVSEEIAVNRRCKCPRCGSRRIDQAIYDRAIEGEWYHCADCGAWYNENGELDEEGEYN